MRAINLFVLLFIIGCGLESPPPSVPPSPRPSPQATPSLSALVPNSGYRDRVVELQLAASNTHFESGTLVDFDDPEIRLVFTYNSSVSLKIFAQIGERARLGPHDVTVATFGPQPDQPVELLLKGGFTVLPALAFESTGGAVVQGGLTQLAVLNHDYRDAPLLPSSIVIKEGPLLLNLQVATAYRYGWLGLVDARQSPGPLHIALQGKSPLGEDVIYRTAEADPHAGNVETRPALELVPGQTRRREQLAAPYQTNLYRVELDDAERILMVTYENVGVGLLLDGISTITAPASGRFREGQRITLPSLRETTYTALALAPQKGSNYLAVFSGGFGGAPDRYAYDITARATAAQKIDLTETRADGPSAPLVSLPLDTAVLGVGGALDSTSDIDYIKFTAGRSGRVFAQATGPQAYAIKLTFLQSDCLTQLAPGRGFQQEAEVMSGVEYCIRLSAAAATPYQFILTPEL